MGRYTTLEEEVQRFKKMALVTEGEITKKPPCGCEKPEDEDKNKEIITGEKELDEIIRCQKKGDCKLVSHKGKTLGHGSRKAMEKREKQVNYFKHLDEMEDRFIKAVILITETLSNTMLRDLPPDAQEILILTGEAAQPVLDILMNSGGNGGRLATEKMIELSKTMKSTATADEVSHPEAHLAWPESGGHFGSVEGYVFAFNRNKLGAYDNDEITPFVALYKLPSKSPKNNV